MNPIDYRLIQEDVSRSNKYNKYNKLCKEILCIIGPITCSCTIFMLWFLHEIDSEFHNSTSY